MKRHLYTAGLWATVLIFVSFQKPVYAQNSLNSGDFSTGTWGTGQAMGASAGGSLIITKGVTTAGDKYFRFYGDGSPCGEYQPNADGDFFTHNTVITAPNGNCGGANAWRINMPSAASNVVFKTDGGNDGMDRSIAFVVQGAVVSVSSVTRAPAANVYPGQDVVVTANLTADFSTGQAAWLRYTNDGFATSTVVKMTGSGTSRTATIPGATNAPSTAVAYYVFTSSDGASISPADADFYTINLNNNGGSNYTYTTQAGWVVVATGNWGTAATWNANAVPPTNANMGAITFGAGVTLTMNQDAIVSSINIATGKTFVGSNGAARTLTITGGGAFTRVGTFTQTAFNTTVFQNGGSISALTTWQNLHVGGGTLTPVGVQTIVGNFQINNGGSISTSATYTATSALVYNTGGSYNVGNEWTLGTVGAAAAGRPNDVIINSGTTLNLPTTNRLLARDITIESGATLNLNVTSGDILVQRNWVNNGGTFNPNNRAVQFVGTSISSTITNASGETFAYLILNKTTSGNLTLNNNVTVSAGVGDVLQMLGAATNATTYGVINLNGNNLTLSGAGGNIFLGTHTAAITRNIIGTGNVFITGAKTVTRTSFATLVTATTVNVVLTNSLNFGASLTTIGGTLTINSGGFVQTNPPIYGVSSTLAYNSGGAYGVNTEWTSTATSGAAALGRPNDVVVRNGTTLNMTTTNRGLAQDLTIESGAVLNLNATSGDLFLQRNWSNAGTFNPNNRAVGFYGTSIASTITNSAGETFAYLIIAKTTTGGVTLNNNVTIAGNSGDVLQLINATTNIGSLNLNGNNLSLTGTAGNISVGAGALIRNITGAGNLIISGGTKTVTRSATSTLVIAAGINVQISNGLNFGASITTLNGTLTINSGGSVVTNPPLYGAASTLIYNQGGAIAVGVEWNSVSLLAAPVAGRPANVTIDNNTTLTTPATSRSMYRDLLVKTGSSLALNTTAGANLSVGGNWTREASTTFTHNGRLVTFWGVAPLLATTITVPGGETFDAVTLAKTAGIAVNLNSNVTIGGALTFTTGTLSIGSNTLTLNGTTAGSTVTSGFSGTLNSTLNIGGATTTFGIIAFVTGVQTLGTLTINRTGVPSGTAAVTLNSGLTVNNGSGLNNSVLNLTSGVLALNAGFTFTVANTSITGASSSNFVFAATTARFAYLVTGAGTYSLNYPLGSSLVTSPSAYRPLLVNSLVQSATNTYSAAATAGPAASAGTSLLYTAPIVGVSSVRYYPFTTTTIGNLTSIGSVSIDVGADEVSTINNLVVSQVIAASWQNIGVSGTTTKTSTLTVGVASATTYFAIGFTSFGIVYVTTTGNDANSGQTANNVPAGTGPKLTLNAATNAVINGGTISYLGTYTAQTWNLNKNVNLTTAGATSLAAVTLNLTAKGVMPFTETDVNTTTDRITVTAHQLTTGMPVTFFNYGNPNGLMPSGINTGTDQITVGSNIPTGQPVIYQAYPDAGAAGGLSHGTTYFAININPTTIQLATTYANALSSTAINITSTGSASSHAIIESVPQGLEFSTVYFVIVTDANTIQLASSNANALAGTAIDLLTNGGGNHVLVYAPTISGALTGSPALNVNDVQSHINPYIALTSTNPTVTLTAGTFTMQPTIVLPKTMTLNGAGMGSTILSGEGKISSNVDYFGIKLNSVTAGTVTISNLRITGYYNGINRFTTTPNTNATTNIDNVDASDNFSRGINFEGTGAISAALNIRNGIASNNNGVGVNSHGINISGMSKTGVNIRNMTLNGNRNSGIEIGTGAVVSVVIRGNSISGVNAASPLSNSVTEFGIGFNGPAVAPTGSNTAISNNSISIFGRGGIECRGCVGNLATSGAGSFRIASNYITQAGGPFTIDPAASSPANEIRDIAAIAVGNISSSGNSASMVIDTNQIASINQPNAITTDYTAFGIVTAGNSHVLRANIVTGCEIGIQAQQGSSGNENNTPDDFYSRDNTATSTGFLANRNSIFGNTDFGARNQVGGTINFMGNWWGHENGPTHASNTDSGLPGFGAGAGQTIPAGSGIAYNAHIGVEPDEDLGTPFLQITKGLNFRLKPSTNSIELSGAGALYIINQGLSVCQSLTPTTGLTDTLDIAPITWTLPSQSLLIRRRMHLRGNFGTVTTKPVINGTGSSVHPQEQGINSRMMINMAAQNSGVENLEIRVNVPAAVSGVSNLIGIGDTVINAASVVNGMLIKNNDIINTGSYNFFSFGLYVKSLNYSNDPSIVTITGNTIGSSGTNFGAPIRMWSCRGTISDNTLYGFYAFRWGTPCVGTGTSNVSNNTFVGSVELNSPQANSVLNVNNNTFERNGSVAHSQGIEVRLSRFSNTFVNIFENTFNDIGQGGHPYWGILALRCQNISVVDNIFNAHSTATDFQFILASTRQQGTLANPTDNFLNSISVKGNQFNGNASAGTNKVGINFARHRSEQTFGTIEMGGPGAEANTFTGLNRYFELFPVTANYSTLGLPYSLLAGTPDATVVPMDVNFDAFQNIYEVSGGNKLPAAMTKAELIELEDKVQHAIDFADLGFITLKEKYAVVTSNSFLPGYTAVKLFNRAMPHVSDGWTVLSQAGIFSESITVADTLTFQSTGTTTLQNLTMNGTGKILTLEDNHTVTNVVTLTDGVIVTEDTSELYVENTAAAAVVGGSDTAHIHGNLRRAIATGTSYNFPVGNGTVEELLTMNFTSVSGLNDVNVRFTNNAPGTNLTNFIESYGQFSEVLQSGYWIVDPNPGGTSNNYEMRMKPGNFTDFPLGKAAFSIVKRVGAGNWAKNGTISNPVPFNNGVWPDGTLRRTGMSGFSNFGVGAGSLVPLPLSIVAFDAQIRSGRAVVTWQVVKEDENTTYVVEKSLNGIDFQLIGTIPGEAKAIGYYEFTDPTWVQSEAQQAYYRLRILEEGKTSYSQIEQLSIRNQPQPQIWPNPAKDVVFVRLGEASTVRMVNVTGKVVMNEKLGRGVQTIPVSHLPAGFYHIEVKSEYGIARYNIQKD